MDSRSIRIICTLQRALPAEYLHLQQLLSRRFPTGVVGISVTRDSYRYVAGVFGQRDLWTKEQRTALDMKHFLPRILQALVNEEDVRSLDETLLDKLCCHFPECWTKEEIDWLKRFAVAWV